MLAKEKSRNGLEIITFDGKLMASKIDPLKEARDFIDGCANRIRDCSVVFVIGLGCGYHLLELLKKYPNKKFIVLEARQELIALFKARYSIESAMVNLFHLQNLKTFKSSSIVREGVRAFYTIVKLRSSTITDPILYESIERTLIGREESELSWLLEVRTKMSAPLRLPFQTVRLVKEQAVSIKDLLELSAGVDYLKANKKNLELIGELIK